MTNPTPQPIDVGEVELEAIQARCDAATPEPWSYGNQAVWQMEMNGEGNSPVCVAEFITLCDGDGEFIAHARQDIPRLLAAVRTLAGKVKELEQPLPDTVVYVANPRTAADWKHKAEKTERCLAMAQERERKLYLELTDAQASVSRMREALEEAYAVLDSVWAEAEPDFKLYYTEVPIVLEQCKTVLEGAGEGK